jgi:hypothetical protein
MVRSLISGNILHNCQSLAALSFRQCLRARGGLLSFCHIETVRNPAMSFGISGELWLP